MTEETSNKAYRSFEIVTLMPKRIILIGLMLIGLATAFVSQLSKDTTADAFIAKSDPALIYKNKVKAIFGLADPIVWIIKTFGNLCKMGGMVSNSQRPV